MTLLYLECHLIPNWHSRSTFAWFLEQLLKDLVSWGRPGECPMIDHFLRDASGVFVLPVLEYCSAVWWSATDTHLKLLDRVVNGTRFLTGVCLSVTLLIADLLQFFVCCVRSFVTRCTHLMMRYLDRMCQCGHIGIPMRHLPAEPRSTAGPLFPSQCPSGMILINTCVNWLNKEQLIFNNNLNSNVGLQSFVCSLVVVSVIFLTDWGGTASHQYNASSPARPLINMPPPLLHGLPSICRLLSSTASHQYAASSPPWPSINMPPPLLHGLPSICRLLFCTASHQYTHIICQLICSTKNVPSEPGVGRIMD